MLFGGEAGFLESRGSFVAAFSVVRKFVWEDGD